jgi:DNA helicase-2/ATP-dependent DNA helicase PcrA
LFNYVQQLKARDYYDQQADKVSLLTMHAAKGLEFPWVYVVGFEQGQIPFSTASQQQKFYHLSPEVRLQEEKRLLYVAMTRAKYGLYLLTPKFRWRQATEPSRFLELIVDQVELVQDEQLRRYQQRKKEQELADRQKSLF